MTTPRTPTSTSTTKTLRTEIPGVKLQYWIHPDRELSSQSPSVDLILESRRTEGRGERTLLDPSGRT